MPLVFEYWPAAGRDDLGNEVVRLGTMQLSEAAEIGETAISSIALDDPGATMDLHSWRAFTVRETSAPSNNTLVWRGVTQDRRVSRAVFRTGSQRRWMLDLADANVIPGMSLLTDASAKRPAETSGDRLRWLLSTRPAYRDMGHVTYPTDAMDANDYRGQLESAVIADCAVAGGYNFWVAGSEVLGVSSSELFFLDPDSSSYASTLAISNDLADVDSVTTFAPLEDATLRRSGTRIAGGVYLPYQGGAVYVTNHTTQTNYGYVDHTAPMANVKTAARAIVIANKFLSDNSTEDDRISCTISVPAASVNALRAGHLVSGKFTHLPGYETASDFRVLRRTVVQEEAEAARGYFRLVLELSPAAAPSCPVSMANRVVTTKNDESAPLISGDLFSWDLAVTPTAATNLVIGWASCTNPEASFLSDMTGLGSWTTAFAGHAGSASGGSGATAHITSALVYQGGLSAGSVDVSCECSYNHLFGTKTNQGTVIAIATSATSPVQTKGEANGGGASITLDAAPTAGNILIMGVSSAGAGQPQPEVADPSWVLIADTTPTSAQLYAKCVSAGDSATISFTTNARRIIAVTEWAIT